ncbi:hypothetical protein [Nonomuraea sp. SBT364]|nr:hypothetical protein [Nonomuraea sp. SBT364]
MYERDALDRWYDDQFSNPTTTAADSSWSDAPWNNPDNSDWGDPFSG